MEITTAQFASMMNVDYLTARGGLSFLHSQGLIREIRRDRPKGGRGRSTIVYQIPEQIMLDIKARHG